MLKIRFSKKTIFNVLMNGKIILQKVIISLLFAISISCASTIKSADAGPIDIGEFNEDVLNKIIKAITNPPYNLEIVRNNGGLLLTSPKEYSGKERGFWIWKKTYEERTSFSIEIFPTSINNNFFIQINAYTEERPNTNYPWKRILSQSDQERSSSLLNTILKELET